jgi:hypothetical protein
MSIKNRQLLVAGVLAGSLWGSSEVVLGTFIKGAALPLRGTMMTAIGVGILFAVFALRRSIAAAALAVLTTLTIKIICAVYLGGLDSIINSSLAVLLEGSAIVLAVTLLRNVFINTALFRSALTAITILGAGTMFYIIGSRLAPCPYLKSLSATQFLLHEILPWSLFSALTAPLGYLIGLKLKEHVSEESVLTAPALLTTACCWIACAITVIFS